MPCSVANAPLANTPLPAWPGPALLQMDLSEAQEALAAREAELEDVKVGCTHVSDAAVNVTASCRGGEGRGASVS